MTEEIRFTLDKDNPIKVIDVNRKKVFFDVYGHFSSACLNIICKSKDEDEKYGGTIASVYKNRFETVSAFYSYQTYGREIFERPERLVFKLDLEDEPYYCEIKVKLLLEDWK